MINKINYILDNKQKLLLLFLLVFWTIVYILETIGLGTVPIILTTILNEKNTIDIPFLDEIIIYITSIFPEEQNKLFSVSIVILSFFILKSLLFVLMIIFEANTIKNLNISLREKTLKYYLSLPYKKTIDVNNAQITRHITLDVSLTSSLLISLVTLINQIFLFTFIVCFLVYVNYQVTFLVLPVFGLFFCLFYVLTNKKLVRLGTEKQKINGEIIKKINNFFDNLKEIIIYNKKKLINENFKIDFTSVNNKIAKILILKKIPKVLYELLGIFFIFLVMFYFIENNFSKDKIIVTLSFITIAILRILPSINLITQNISNMKSCKYSFDTIFDLYKKMQIEYEETEFKKKDRSQLTFNDIIEFKDVSFNYINSKSKISDVNLKIKKNSIVGIFGPSGSGKTTFVNLLSGLLPPTHGKIFSDNVSIDENILEWQKKLSYIPQENYLLDSSILENIIFSDNNKEIDFDKIDQIIRLLNLEKLIKESTEGLQTQVGDKGIKLSGGQKQRIAIARALYKDSQILIFDESTSSLDHETEKLIISDIYKIKTKTIFIISHKLEILSNCDQIIELSEGKIKNIQSKN